MASSLRPAAICANAVAIAASAPVRSRSAPGSLARRDRARPPPRPVAPPIARCREPDERPRVIGIDLERLAEHRRGAAASSRRRGTRSRGRRTRPSRTRPRTSGCLRDPSSRSNSARAAAVAAARRIRPSSQCRPLAGNRRRGRAALLTARPCLRISSAAARSRRATYTIADAEIRVGELRKQPHDIVEAGEPLAAPGRDAQPKPMTPVVGLERDGRTSRRERLGVPAGAGQQERQRRVRFGQPGSSSTARRACAMAVRSSPRPAGSARGGFVEPEVGVCQADVRQRVARIERNRALEVANGLRHLGGFSVSSFSRPSVSARYASRLDVSRTPMRARGRRVTGLRPRSSCVTIASCSWNTSVTGAVRLRMGHRLAGRHSMARAVIRSRSPAR